MNLALVEQSSGAAEARNTQNSERNRPETGTAHETEFTQSLDTRAELSSRTASLVENAQELFRGADCPLATALDASTNFQTQLTAEQRQMALDVLNGMEQTPQATGLLMSLIDRSVGSQSAVLNRDSNGVTLLEHLATLANNDRLTRDLEGKRAEMLTSLVRELGNTADINRGMTESCTATVAQMLLAERQPAELARLIRELGTKGEMTLQDGQKVSLAKDNLSGDQPKAMPLFEEVSGNWRAPRSITERMFQDSMMHKYAESPLVGQYDHETKNMFDAVVFTEGARRIDAHGQSLEQKEAVVATIAERLNANEATPVSLSWRGQYFHAVLVEGIKDGYVYFKDPTGCASDPDIVHNGRSGSYVHNGPERDLYDRTQGLWRMSVEDFTARLRYAIVPDANFKGVEQPPMSDRALTDGPQHEFEPQDKSGETARPAPDLTERRRDDSAPTQHERHRRVTAQSGRILQATAVTPDGAAASVTRDRDDEIAK